MGITDPLTYAGVGVEDGAEEGKALGRKEDLW